MIGIVEYDGGNRVSVTNALERIGVDYFISHNPQKLQNADKILFPGVGHARACMESLHSFELDTFLKTTKQPILAICVGMQLLFQFSEEGNTECLGLIPGVVQRFHAMENAPVPHTGWNSVFFPDDHKKKNDISCTQQPLFQTSTSLLQNKMKEKDFYFVHSYYCKPFETKSVFTLTDYCGQLFCSSVMQNNLWGVQFHPEKSGKIGEEILSLFASQ